jgi:predicted amidohydrolase YtcJ
VDLDNSVLLSYEEIHKRLQNDPRMRFVGDYLRRDWEEQASESRGAEAEEAIESFRRKVPSLYRDLREMSAAGIEFLAGSDAAVLFMYPGTSLHGELENLVRKVGIEPWEAMRAATVNPARFFGLLPELGAIRPGFYADLVLLRGNPLMLRGMEAWRGSRQRQVARSHCYSATLARLKRQKRMRSAVSPQRSVPATCITFRG